MEIYVVTSEEGIELATLNKTAAIELAYDLLSERDELFIEVWQGSQSQKLRITEVGPDE